MTQGRIIHAALYWSDLAATLVLATGLGAAVALAADEPANVVKYRKHFMDANGANISMIASVVKGEVSLSDQIPAHANALAEQGKLLTANLKQLFPKGTAKGETAEKSAALPAIWEKWSDFEQAAQKFQEESAKFAEVAQGRRHGRDRPAAGRARQAGLRRLPSGLPRKAAVAPHAAPRFGGRDPASGRPPAAPGLTRAR